jgi:hypothetical protein
LGRIPIKDRKTDLKRICYVVIAKIFSTNGKQNLQQIYFIHLQQTRAVLMSIKFGLPHFTSSQINEADKALETWRLFLLGQIKHPGKYQQHVLPFDIVSGSSMLELPTNINRYLLSSVDIDPVAGNHQALVYVKIPYFIFIGGIQIKPEQWKNTMIHVNKGIIGTNKFIIPQSFGNYIIDKAKKVG